MTFRNDPERALREYAVQYRAQTTLQQTGVRKVLSVPHDPGTAGVTAAS